MVPFNLWSEALWCGQEVVGELRHERAIRSLFVDPIPARGVDLDTVADLVPEFGNRFDPCAVAVQVDGRVVGYLPREDAQYYHPVLADLVAQGLQPRVPCHVWASQWKPSDWQRPDERSTEFHASVAIALGQPHMLVPVNLPPPGDYELLPSGTAVPVEPDDDHLGVVGPLLPPEGECWVHVTLHAEAIAPTVVEVRLEGQRIGRLGDRVSAEFLPAIKYLDDLRSQTAARAILRGNRLTAEITLHAARAQELPATWPDGLTRSPIPATGTLLDRAEKGVDLVGNAG
jgi:hypothetical protein